MLYSIGLPSLFFLVAFFYAIVGLGGGSSYLALLALAGLPFEQIPVIALICNLVVTTGGFWHFYRAGFVRWRIIVPFVALSIPLAYWGGRLTITRDFFSILLGGSLLFAAIRLFISDSAFKSPKEVPYSKAWRIGLPVGGLLGFLSGLVGIGGGIFLGPILILSKWVNAKEAAAASSFFIMVNSLSGLLGHLGKASVDFAVVLPLALPVFLGGQMGSRFGAYRIPNTGLKRILAAFILYVSVRLIGAGL
ncbi:MAG: sulfite exporter TauE/SafE family protein [Candidatus Omnitrophica bacterium]|nr:sulfite exporter TauE/SafE family protein [Candidatus Omnitrophota bacterium]